MPAVGNLLLSEPFMLDPGFMRSVVLLCEHHPEEGTMGYVLNQPTNLILSDLIQDIPNINFPVFLGGPVGHDAIHFIHRCDDRIQDGMDLGKGVFWGGNFEALKVMLEKNQIASHEIKFFLGYSGWDPGQLDRELTEKSWMVCTDYNPELVFVHESEPLWKEAVIAMGPKYAHVANFPIDPRMN